MLAPLAVVGTNPAGALRAVVTYLLLYAAMSLCAFAVVLAVARKTRSAEIDTWGGLFEYAPGLSVLMSLFLFSLAGIPPLGGWLAKFVIFKALVEPDLTVGGVTLAVVVAVNSVIALYYRSEEHTSELQSLMPHLVSRLLLDKKKNKQNTQ